jgi:hypothetical protein
VVGDVVSVPAGQAVRVARPLPLNATKPAARRTVRRVAAVDEDSWLGSGIRLRTR